MCDFPLTKQSFQQMAKEYDDTVSLTIPYYDDLIDNMINLIPYNHKDKFTVIDLGAGTGNLALAIKENFPYAQITCLDLCENMLELAFKKLEGYKDIHYEIDDFYTYAFSQKYNVAFSSLSIHHLTSDNSKKMFYNQIYDALTYGGIFYNADLVTGNTREQDKLYVKKWRQSVLKQVSSDFMLRELLPRNAEGHYPAPLTEQIHWLEEIGFSNVDVIFKYYNIALFGGHKQYIARGQHPIMFSE